jgi:hypothetical protein
LESTLAFLSSFLTFLEFAYVESGDDSHLIPSVFWYGFPLSSVFPLDGLLNVKP